MFEKEAKEYIYKHSEYDETFDMHLVTCSSEKVFRDAAEFGYDKGYRDAEEHYMNVIASQHKLVDESKKEEFKKCMKCTDSTYQQGFKDDVKKANDWHFIKDGDFPKENKQYLVYLDWLGRKIEILSKQEIKVYQKNVIAWKDVIPPEC